MAPLDSPAQHQPVQSRWGWAWTLDFVVVPVLLLRHQKDLGLDDGAMVTLLNVIASWWYEGKLPFPGTHTIAQRMGVSERTVQRHLTKLEKLAYYSGGRRRTSETRPGERAMTRQGWC